MGKEGLPMSWKETCPMTERMHFVSDLLKDERSMTELCRMYGISRPTGYKWRDRFDSGGVAAPADRSHAPLHQTYAVDEGVVPRLLQVRRQQPTRGSRQPLGHRLGRGLSGRFASTACR